MAHDRCEAKADGARLPLCYIAPANSALGGRQSRFMARSRALLRISIALTSLAVLIVGGSTRAQSPALEAAARLADPLRIVDSLADAARPDTALLVLQP